MPEGQGMPRKRRRTTEAQGAPELKPEPQADQGPLRIRAEQEPAPDWIVTADRIEGAAERRSGQSGRTAAAQPKEEPAKPQAAKAPAKKKTIHAAGTRRGGARITMAEPQKRVPRKRRRKGGIGKILLGIAGAAALVALITAGVIGGSRLLDIKRTLDKGEKAF